MTEYEEEVNLDTTMVAIALGQFITIENAIMDAKQEAQKAVLAANPAKKQAAIERVNEILGGIINESEE